VGYGHVSAATTVGVRRAPLTAIPGKPTPSVGSGIPAFDSRYAVFSFEFGRRRWNETCHRMIIRRRRPTTGGTGRLGRRDGGSWQRRDWRAWSASAGSRSHSNRRTPTNWAARSRAGRAALARRHRGRDQPDAGTGGRHGVRGGLGEPRRRTPRLRYPGRRRRTDRRDRNRRRTGRDPVTDVHRDRGDGPVRLHGPPVPMVGDVQVSGKRDGDWDGGRRDRDAAGRPVRSRGLDRRCATGRRRAADEPRRTPVRPGMDGAHVVVDQPGQPTCFARASYSLIRCSTSARRSPSGGRVTSTNEGCSAWHSTPSSRRTVGCSSGTAPRTRTPTAGSSVRATARSPTTGTTWRCSRSSGRPAPGPSARVDANSERVLLEVPSPQFNHNGGAVTFGPDGHLYTTVGDGGNANDVGLGHVADWYDGNEGGNAQNVEANLLGKSSGWTSTPAPQQATTNRRGAVSPTTSPRTTPSSAPRGWTKSTPTGCAQPWRISFDGETLIAADVGQDLYEEVDVIEAGGNYGWNVREGSTASTRRTRPNHRLSVQRLRPTHRPTTAGRSVTPSWSIPTLTRGRASASRSPVAPSTAATDFRTSPAGTSSATGARVSPSRRDGSSSRRRTVGAADRDRE